MKIITTIHHQLRSAFTALNLSLRVSALLVVTLSASAQAIEVELEPPTFTFNLTNALPQTGSTKLAPNEYELSVAIKPLLDAKQYSKVIELLKNNSNVEKSTGLLLIAGQVYLAAKQPDNAEKALLAVLEKAPNLLRVHRTLAALYLQKKQLKKAQHHLTKAIENGVQDPQFFGQLAYINLEQGSAWSAIAGYQQALLLDPNNNQWKHGLLYALQRAGNNQAALNMVDELINETPDDKRLWLQRAQINLASNEKPKALTSMEMALRHGETASSNLLSTAQLHLSAGSMARAADLLIKITAHNPQAFTQINSAINWLISEGEVKQANRILANIKGITKLPKPQQSLYYAALGSAQEHNNIERAVKHFNKSLALNPNQASVLIKLAQHYQSKQQFSRAQLYYQRAQVFPNFIKPALAGLAQIALEQEYYDKALAYLEKLKPLSNNKVNIDKNIAVLKRLKAQES